MRVIPTINTARLTLRGMRMQDFDRYAQIWSMPEVTRHICGAARPRGESWTKFLTIAGHWQISGFGTWAVEERGASAFSGQVGFRFGMRGLGDDFDSYPEAGWIKVPETHGKGLASEDALAAHDWFDRIVSTPTVCVISPENHASIKLAKAIGYAELRDAALDDDPVQLFLRKGPRV